MSAPVREKIKVKGSIHHPLTFNKKKSERKNTADISDS